VPMRQCPAPGCGRWLTDRQAACSGKCRAALSRQRRKARLLALARALVEALEAQ
jgi:predicted nucleic acid-binding Zn ribbon protein